jgi:hypothetical protein
VSATPNTDAQNKITSLILRSGADLGEEKFVTVIFSIRHGSRHNCGDEALIVCRCFVSKTTDILVFSVVTAYKNASFDSHG